MDKWKTFVESIYILLYGKELRDALRTVGEWKTPLDNFEVIHRFVDK